MEDVAGLERTAGSEPTAQRAAGHQGIDLGRRPRGDGRRFKGCGFRWPAGNRSGLDRRRAGRQLRQVRGGAGAGAYCQHNGENHGGWAPHRSQAPRWVGRGLVNRTTTEITHKTESSIIRRRCHNNARRGKAIGENETHVPPPRPEMRSSKSRGQVAGFEAMCRGAAAPCVSDDSVRCRSPESHSGVGGRRACESKIRMRPQPIMRPLPSGLPS